MRHLIFTMALLLTSIVNATPQGTAFTYQGELLDNNSPANGIYDFRITLFDASTGGTSQGQQYFDDITVTQGIFTVAIDVGDVPFMGDENWLELEVRAGTSAGNYEILTPRSLITNSPYAIQSQFVGIDGVDSQAIKDGQITANDIGFGQVATNNLADYSVTTLKIANAAITNMQLANNAVSSNEIIDGSINNVDIQAGTITNSLLANAIISTDKIINDAVTQSTIATGAVGSDEILDYSISQTDLQINSISADNIINDSITIDDIGTDAVGSNEILDGSITLDDVNTALIQARISASCSAGSSIREIASNGSVICEPGNTGWSLTGNSSTSPGTHFLGTSDNQALFFNVNNQPAIRIYPATANEAANYVGGHASNAIDNGVVGSIISGGGHSSFFNRISEDNGFIGGGRSNVIGDGDTDYNDGFGSVIAGGLSNTIDGQSSTIGGGTGNSISGANSTIAGGQANQISANYGFAAGYGSKVNHIGGWVWNDFSDVNLVNSFATTADHQFLIRATGGVGIGTNAPASPIHVVGQGTSTGSTANSNEVVMTVQPRDTADNVAIALNALDNLQDSALIFAKSGVPEYDIRNHRNNGFEFSYYDADNSLAKTTMMRLTSTPSQKRVDFNVDVEPELHGVYNLGAPSYRWGTIYSLNPLDVSSDFRLKNNIQELQYGLVEIMNMRPVSYDWKDQKNHGQHLGLIAQEVETIIPEIVSKANDEAQTRSMRYSELIPVLIKATQEQQVLIDQQDKQINELKTLVKALLEQQ